MKTLEKDYEFSVQISDFDWDDESQLSKIQSDQFIIVPFFSEGLSMFAIETKSASPESALGDLESFLSEQLPQVKIIRIDLDLVSLSQISERIDVSREAVRLWARGERRESFPKPFTSAGQSLLWAWSNVFDWLSSEEVDSFAQPLPINLVERMNGVYARNRITLELGWPLRQTQRTQRYSGQLSKESLATPARSLRGKMKYGAPLTLTIGEKKAL